MSFRPAKRTDFATGLVTQHALYDFWGVVVTPAHTHIESQAREEALLSMNLWIWKDPGEPAHPPRDTEKAPSYRLFLEQELGTLRKMTADDSALPTNFLATIWRHSCEISAINEKCPWHPLALLSPGNHPSNALRNAYVSAILAERISRKLNLSLNDRRSVAAAALTMNWSIFQLQDRLSSSKNSLGAGDIHNIKNHPFDVASLLRQLGLDNKVWLEAIEQHHEEPDGRGYPKRLSEHETTLGAQILRACDRFVALTVSRRFRTGMLTQDAAQSISAIVPERCGIRAALMADIGAKPPGGFWLSQENRRLHLALGRDSRGIMMALPLSALDAPTPQPLTGLHEIPPPDLSCIEYRLAMDRLDMVSIVLANEHKRETLGPLAPSSSVL